MNEIYTDREKIRSQIAEAYYKLPVAEQKIAQLMSVIYEPVAKNTLMSCANQIGLQDENGRPLTIKTFKPFIDHLLEIGIIVQHSGYGPQCHPLLAEIAARDAVRSGQFDQLVAIVEDCIPITTQWKGRRAFRSQRQFLREVRIGIYRQDLAFINQQFEDYYRHSHQPEKISINEICQQVCNNPFDAAWFSTLSPELYELCLSSILRESLIKLTPATEALALVQQDFQENSGRDIKFLRTILTEQLLLRGRLEEARASLNPIEQEYGPDSAVLWGSLTFLEGDTEEAIAHFSVALNALKKNQWQKPDLLQYHLWLIFHPGTITGKLTRKPRRKPDLYPIDEQTNRTLAARSLPATPAIPATTTRRTCPKRHHHPSNN